MNVMVKKKVKKAIEKKRSILILHVFEKMSVTDLGQESLSISFSKEGEI